MRYPTYVGCVIVVDTPSSSLPARYGTMWTAGRTAKKVFKQPGAFALAVVKQFRANQGVLLAGPVAYYTLLSRSVAHPHSDGDVHSFGMAGGNMACGLARASGGRA